MPSSSSRRRVASAMQARGGQVEAGGVRTAHTAVRTQRPPYTPKQRARPEDSGVPPPPKFFPNFRTMRGCMKASERELALRAMREAQWAAAAAELLPRRVTKIPPV